MKGNLQEILQNEWEAMQRGCYDFTNNGKCSGCGNCCSALLPVSDMEIKHIKRYMKQHDVKEHSSCTPEDVKYDLTCPFMDSTKPDHKCDIYPVRPLICRSFICSKPKMKIEEAKRFAYQTRKPVNMRKEFFGHE